MANMKPIEHINPFAGDYSFEAKTAKLPHYTQLENLAILQNRNPEQQAAQQIYSNWRPAVQNIASSGSASTGTPTNIVTNPPAPTDGGGGGDIYAGLKSDISAAWDQYLGSLQETTDTYLPQQRIAQEDIANTQRNLGTQTINTQKASSLRDIASNIRSAFQAGNIFLGNRGAGDSSATNQYAFAIQQEAAKQGSLLNEFVNTQLNNLNAQHSTQLSQISLWFSDAQRSARDLLASGQLSKMTDLNNLSKQILDTAISAKYQLERDTKDRYNALVSWALSNSTNMGQVREKMAQIPQAMGQMQVDSGGSYYSQPISGISTSKRRTDAFGNVIS